MLDMLVLMTCTLPNSLPWRCPQSGEAVCNANCSCLGHSLLTISACQFCTLPWAEFSWGRWQFILFQKVTCQYRARSPFSLWRRPSHSSEKYCGTLLLRAFPTGAESLALRERFWRCYSNLVVLKKKERICWFYGCCFIAMFLSWSFDIELSASHFEATLEPLFGGKMRQRAQP